MSQAGRTFCLPWFDPHSYQGFRATLLGGHRLPSSYARWRENALEVAEQVERQGRRVERVTVRPAPFARWCRNRGVLADSAALDGFARHLVAARDLQTLEHDMAALVRDGERDVETSSTLTES